MTMRAPTPTRRPPASREGALAQIESAALAVAPFAVMVIGLIASVALAVAVLVLRPQTVQDLWASLAGDAPKVFWYLSRASSFVSFGLIALSMLLGLAITNKAARVWPGGPTFVALHEHTALTGLVFGVLHAAFLLGDRYIGYSFFQLLVPFASGDYRPFWVGLGQIALWTLAPVTLSYYVRRAIGQRAWRLIHYANFGIFGLILVHSLLSGTDSGLTVVRLAYWGAFVAVASLTLYRVLFALIKNLTTPTRRPPAGP